MEDKKKKKQDEKKKKEVAQKKVSLQSALSFWDPHAFIIFL